VEVNIYVFIHQVIEEKKKYLGKIYSDPQEA